MGDVLFVPNEVTVDVPLERHATTVIVQSYQGESVWQTFPMKSCRNVSLSRKSVSTHGSVAKSTNVLINEVSKSTVLWREFEHYP